ncbi:hypothetical protein ABZT28_31935 [Streptomyces sp. NPDC005388]|uniref:hypothetical protein n=1 Tax=Streptomyces sp. NPDC005388 TaxID=3156717 RepID=UPI0033BCEB76
MLQHRTDRKYLVPLDRARDLGARPVSLSEYIVGQSLLIPGLPDNDVRRLARAHFTAQTRTEPLFERTSAA